MKIMIVDDHSAMRRVLKQLLHMSYSDNVEIKECESGEEAIEEYQTFLPDYILMDYQLKRINGLQTAQIISQKAPDANVILVTSYDSVYLRNKAFQLNLRGFVSKENLSQLIEFITPQILQQNKIQ
jgi:DNA-binding NarL/FixJ family response regulator